MASSSALEAQYTAIIDGIALLSDAQPTRRAQGSARTSSANRSSSRGAALPFELSQHSFSARPGSRTSSVSGQDSGSHAAYDNVGTLDTAMQPSFTSSFPVRTRPVSRDRLSSAWSPQPLGQLPVHRQNSHAASINGARQPVFGRTSSERSRVVSNSTAERPGSRQLVSPQITRLSHAGSAPVERPPSSQRPSSAQRQLSAAAVGRPHSRQQQHEMQQSSALAGEGHASHAMGMTLSQYMSEMPTREAAAGESWARPVSASLTAEDCQPPPHSRIAEDISSIEDDDSPGWRDDDHWDTCPAPQPLSPVASSPSGPEDTEDLAASCRHLRSARGNGLDLRPATAAGVYQSQGASSSTPQDAHATRQTDLGSLSAQLFAPRPQTQGGCFRPPSRRLSRPSTAQRAAVKQASSSSQSQPHQAGQLSHAAAEQQAPGLMVRGGRKVQSARPLERDQRPPSRQKPPPEALHLFQPVHGSSSAAFAPSPVFRATAAGMTRPSTSASIMQQSAANRFKPAPVLQSGRMTLEDLRKLSSAAVSNSQAIASNAAVNNSQAVAADSVAPVEVAHAASVARPSSARPLSGRPRSARPTSASLK